MSQSYRCAAIVLACVYSSHQVTDSVSQSVTPCACSTQTKNSFRVSRPTFFAVPCNKPKNQTRVGAMLKVTGQRQWHFHPHIYLEGYVITRDHGAHPGVVGQPRLNSMDSYRAIGAHRQTPSHRTYHVEAPVEHPDAVRVYAGRSKGTKIICTRLSHHQRLCIGRRHTRGTFV